MQKHKRKTGLLPITVALIFLLNPNIHTIDILPDFVAYIICAHMLRYAKDRAPYFEEARAGFLKLAVVSALKIPAYFVITFARAGNVHDYDVRTLFAFAFGVAEIWLSLSLIENLYAALVYLGERSASGTLIKPFKIGRRGRLGTIDGLRALTTLFVIAKCAGYALPELLVLTNTVSVGEKAFNFARYYPYTIVTVVPLIFIFGVFWAKRCRAYARAVSEAGDFKASIDALFNEEGRAELNKRLWLESLKTALTVMLVATFFVIEINLDNFKGVNLLPPFIFGIVMTLGAYRTAGFVGHKKSVLITGALYTLSAALHYIIKSSFLISYGYEALATSRIASANYVTVLIFSSIETVFFIVFFIALARLLSGFAYKHTGLSPSSERYMRADLDYHKSIVKRGAVWAILASLLAASKCADAFFKIKMKINDVFIEDDVFGTVGTVAESMVPWFGTVVLALTFIFIVYSLYYFAHLKEECDMKYKSE